MKKKFFSVLLALVLVCSLSLVTAAPVAAEGEGTYTLEEDGDGTAEWSTDKYHSGSYSVFLSNGSAGGTDRGKITVLVPAIPIADFSSDPPSYFQYNVTGEEPDTYLNIFLDTTDDGSVNDYLEGVSATHGTVGTWIDVSEINGHYYDSSDSLGSGWTTPQHEKTLEDWKGWFASQMPDEVDVVGVKIIYGGVGGGSGAVVYIDDVTINGVTYDLELPALTEITVDDPNGGEFVSGTYTVEWSYTGYPAPGSGITLAYTTGLGWISFASLTATGLDLSQSCEWDTTGLTDGSNYQVRVAYDPNPSTNDMSDALFTVDNTDPVVEVTSPDGGEEWAGGETYEITWTATDTNMASNPITIEYWDGDSWEAVASGEANDGTYSWTVPELDISDAKVKVTALDKAGNSGSDESDAVFVIDSTVPQVNLTAPPENAYINSGSYEVTATASDSGATMKDVEFLYSLDSGSTWVSIGTDSESPYSVTWELSGLSDQADIQVKAKASDVAGNTDEDINTGITLDRVEPVVTLTAPLDNGYINETPYNVTATATDTTAGVASVEFSYSLDGGSTWVSIGTDTDTADDSYSVSWNLSGLTEQAGIQVKAEASDEASNSASDINTGVTFDKTAPTTPTWVGDGAVATPGKVTLTWTASTDALSGLDCYNIYRSTSSYEVIGTTTETSYEDTTATPATAYTYKVGAVDMAGNEALSDATDEVIFMAEVTVSIDAPASVYLGQVFAVEVDITQVTDFDAAGFDVTFDRTIVELISVDNGLINGVNGTTLEVIWNLGAVDIANPTAGRVTIVINLSGFAGASGEGTLATLHFEAIQLTGSTTAIGLENGCLSNIAAEAIVANWLDDSLEINVLRGDANSDGVVNSMDISEIELIVAGIHDATPGADANGDGKVNALDITKVELLVAGY